MPSRSMNNNDRFLYLLRQYQLQEITAAENDEFFDLLSSGRYDLLLNQSIQQDLEHGFATSSADLPPHIAEEIIRNIYSAEKSTAQIIPLESKQRNSKRWLAAASIVLILFASLFFLNRNNKRIEVNTDSVNANIIVEENRTNKPKAMLMKDGSKIILQPNSSIRYDNRFNDSLREVYLEGEAFFDVKRNPQKPFLVYNGNLITKVLGTSFVIGTNTKTGYIEVAVKTGRVQVYENSKQVAGVAQIESVILTPNQKAIYQVERRILQATLVAMPMPIQAATNIVTVEASHFVYEQEKLLAVFKELEDAYGIEIVVENTNLNNCVFTGDVSSQDLFTKLRIICLTTNSSYEINGTKILIKGTGCQ